MNPVIVPILSLVIILNFIIGIIILSRGFKNKVNFLFGLISVGVSLWAAGILGFYLIKIPLDYLWIIETHSSAAFIAVIFLLFTFNFPTLLTKKIYIRLMPLIPFSIIIYYLFFTKDIIGNVNGVNYEIHSGYIFYSLFVMLCFFIGYFALFLQYKKSSNDEQRIQVKYVLGGAILSSILASISDLMLPYFGIFEYNWLGPIFTFFLVGTIAYAILKHHLFDIKVIATELFTFALWIISFVKIFFSNSGQDLMLNIGIFLSVVLFGILLVRGVLKETELREKITKALEGEKKANDSLELFMTGLQHDIKGYLTPITSAASSLIDGSGAFSKKVKGGILLNESGIGIVKIFERSAIAARDQSDDFMAIAKFRQGKPILSLDFAVDLGSMLDELVSSFKTQAELKGIALEFEKPADKFIISADQVKLKSALRNIIGNSIKFTPKGKVAIEIKKEENDKVLIKLQDTGIGIPAEKIATLFSSPFERTAEARKTAEGSGFGLYFSSLIIGLHNGKIWVESEGDGKGSTFYIELPTKKSEKISTEKDITTKIINEAQVSAIPMEKNKKDYDLWYKDVGEGWLEAHDDKGNLIKEDYWGTTDRINNAKYQRDLEQKLMKKNRWSLSKLFRFSKKN